MLRRRALLVLLATGFWAGPPLGLLWPDGAGQAAWARQGGSGKSGGGSGSSGSGSGSSGSGSGGSGSGHDDDDDDDDHSGNGGGNGGSSGPGGSGNSSAGTKGNVAGKNWVPMLGGDGIHVQFLDGHIERIRGGRFEKIDKAGHLVEKRRATAQEERHLRSLEAELEARGRASGIVTIADVDGRSGRIEITDFRGWRETLSRARYELSDPNGHTVSRRALTPEDIVRVRTLLFLN